MNMSISQNILHVLNFFLLQRVRSEFDGFERLFARFLSESGPSVEWEKIKLLSDDAVSN